MSLKVCLDVSPIGAPKERWTGLARTTWEFVSNLERATSLDLRFSAVGSTYAQSQVVEYLADAGWDTRFIGNPIPKIVKSLATQKAGPFRYAAHMCARAYNFGRTPIAPKSLGELDFYFSFYAKIPSQIRRNTNISAGIFVHDIIPFLFPDHCSQHQRDVLSRILKSIGREDLVIVNSNCTKNDVCQRIDISPENVAVIPLAASDALFKPVTTPMGRDLLKSEYGLDHSRYFLTLHSAAPHKNVPLLIRAYAQYRRSHDGEALPLVIAGGKGDPRNEVLQSAGIDKDQLDGVEFLGFVADEHLAHVYSGARAFFFPSLYEGFGLPVLEALLCGAPAFVANTGSLVELMQSVPRESEGASRLIDASNQDAWVEAFREAETASDIGGDTIGKLRQMYSWQKASDALTEAIRHHSIA